MMLPLQHQTKAQGIALLQQFKRSIHIPCTKDHISSAGFRSLPLPKMRNVSCTAAWATPTWRQPKEEWRFRFSVLLFFLVPFTWHLACYTDQHVRDHFDMLHGGCHITMFPKSGWWYGFVYKQRIQCAKDMETYPSDFEEAVQGVIGKGMANVDDDVHSWGLHRSWQPWTHHCSFEVNLEKSSCNLHSWRRLKIFKEHSAEANSEPLQHAVFKVWPSQKLTEICLQGQLQTSNNLLPSLQRSSTFLIDACN